MMRNVGILLSACVLAGCSVCDKDAFEAERKAMLDRIGPLGNRGTDPCDTVGVIRLVEIGVARGCD